MMYPNDNQIKAVPPRVFGFISIIATVMIWVLFLNYNRVWIQNSFPLSKFLSVLGLNFDLLGVLIASSKTKYFGNFADGGDVERKRQEKENKVSP